MDEQAIAELLRMIAKQVKAWEDRDVKEQIARGDRALSRPAYFHDLDMIAAMLAGQHKEIRLRAEHAGRGRPPNLGALDRDMEIARSISNRAEGVTVRSGIEAAVAKFNVSEKTAEAAWRRFRDVVNSDNEQSRLFFEKLALRGLVKITRAKGP